MTEIARSVNPIKLRQIEPFNIMPEPIAVEFSDTRTPALENYQEDFAPLFGELPRFILLIYDESGNETEVRYGSNTRFKTAGLITRIEWDLPDKVSGKIIISK